MDKKLVLKIVQNCLKQYNVDREAISLNSKEFEELYNTIIFKKENEDNSGLHDIVNDVVYGYITHSPYL